MTTSPGTTCAKTPEVAKLPVAAGGQIGYGARFLSRESLRILGVFLLVVLPLWGFAGLADELREGEGFFFDQPILLALHQIASPGIDALFVTISKLGYQLGVLPADVLIVAWLLYRRRYRDGLFFGLAVIGSLLVNLAVKGHFARLRPELWASIAPEMSYSFPSGHAMGSATLAAALVVLLWRPRWRWWALAGGMAFVLLVGISRVYLGVHYPSDILAGWTAAIAWVMAMHWLVASRAPLPVSTAAAPATHDAIADSGTAQHARANGRDV
ncbi:MAG: phosphatase PAP2 family protein [Arenimonas sp.]